MLKDGPMPSSFRKKGTDVHVDEYEKHKTAIDRIAGLGYFRPAYQYTSAETGKING